MTPGKNRLIWLKIPGHYPSSREVKSGTQTASHITSRAKSREKTNTALLACQPADYARLAFFTLAGVQVQLMNWSHPHSGWVFLHQLTTKTSPPVDGSTGQLNKGMWECLTKWVQVVASLYFISQRPLGCVGILVLFLFSFTMNLVWFCHAFTFSFLLREQDLLLLWSHRSLEKPVEAS